MNNTSWVDNTCLGCGDIKDDWTAWLNHQKQSLTNVMTRKSPVRQMVRLWNPQIQGNLHKTISRLISRPLQARNNIFRCWRRGGGGGRLLPTENVSPTKAVLQRRRRHKDLPGQTEAAGIHQHYTCLIRNAERSSLWWNSRAQLSKMKTYDNVKHTGKVSI